MPGAINMESGFRINKDYASKYDKWRQKEELQKLKDKYGNISDSGSSSSSSSSSESEDENAEALTAEIEKDWLRTLSALKSKDPKIYQKDVKFFHCSNDESSSAESRKKKIKQKRPMYLKDYEREIILKKGGKISDSENETDEHLITKIPAYSEEQEQLKKSFMQAAQSLDDENSSELLVRRQKTRKHQEREEEEYQQWLKGQKDEMKTEKKMEKQLAPLRKYWNNPDLDDGEKFLRDYILNRKYITEDTDEIPTYESIVGEEEVGLSEEETTLEQQEDFERTYNFRFEEPDRQWIKQYPRKIEDSVRRVDNRRSRKRREVKERKKLEKEKKEEELKQLKNLKKKEIAEKIEKLKELTGNTSVGFSMKDLKEDFDPARHKQLMQKIFDDDYYKMEADAEKPVFSDDEGEYWDNWQREEQDDGPDAEDPDFNMDCDYVPSQKGKKKKANKFDQLLQKSKPVFDPDDMEFEEYLDEYYKLDYEDIIGDQPCRFKYRKVQPNNFGLAVDEIFNCPDRELNSWCSLKKMSQYRTEKEEKTDLKTFRKKANNLKKKFHFLPSLQERKDADREAIFKKNQKKRRKTKPKEDESISDNRLEAYGINPRKVKYLKLDNHKRKKSKKVMSAMSV